jgi:hypothetical protein
MLRLMAAVHNVGVVLTGEDITGAANIGVSRNRAIAQTPAGMVCPNHGCAVHYRSRHDYGGKWSMEG